MSTKSTKPAPPDNTITLPALLTQPAPLCAEPKSAGIRPVHKWIFVFAMLALVVGSIFVG